MEDNWPQLAVDRLTLGVFVVDQYRLVLANPLALQKLNLEGAPIGALLRVDGPDGPLADRLVETAAAAPVRFDYHLPLTDGGLRVLPLTSVAVRDGCFLVQIGDRTESPEAHAAGIQASHALKTPLAILSTGLSSLTEYYDRYSDAERREMLAELLDQVRAMTRALADRLPGEFSSGRTGTSPRQSPRRRRGGSERRERG